MIAQINADHAEALVLYCKAFSKATEIGAAKMTAWTGTASRCPR